MAATSQALAIGGSRQVTDWLIHNVRVLSPGKGIVADTLRVRDGKIAAIGAPAPAPGSAPGAPAPGSAPGAPGEQTIDGGGRLLTPGLIDVHIHGIGDSRFEVHEQIESGSTMFGQFGATTAVTTVVPKPGPDLMSQLEQLAAAAALATGATMSMLHIEGPFVALPGAACALVPADVGLLDEMIAACHGQLKVMSLSPDVPGIIPIIERLVERDIVPFVTHTRASVDQAVAGIEAGARHATHFYDVFPLPEQTEPGVRPVGVVEAMLADPRCTVDFVCDGVHVHPVAIKCAVAAKGYEGVILITDSNVGAGLPPGIYPTPWGYPVKVAPGCGARLHDPNHPMNGALAGSALTMNVGIANLTNWLDLPPEQIWAMGTSNPAKLLNLPDKGVIREGADADLVLWDQTGDVPVACRTWRAGRCVYEADN